MKWISTKVVAFVLTMLFMGTSAVYAQTLVDDWGAIGTRLDATGWTLDNDGNTPAGDAYLSGDGTSSNWTGIRGGLDGTVTATTEEALIVSGEFEIIGGEVGEWNPFRFGVFQHPDIDELRNQNTPMALWGTDDGGTFVSNEANAFGYLIVNQTGSEGPVGGNGGSGSAHAVNGGSWISTFSGGTVPLGSPFDHAPRRAVMPEGTYDFALSVQPQADGSVEVRWYIFHEDEQSYWHAGVHTDMTVQQTEFDGFVFSFRPEVEGITGINLHDVQYSLGDPIEIPDAPFSAFFVDEWGAIGDRLAATGWTLDNDSTTLVGDAYLSGDVTSPNWTAIRGGFGSTISATEDEALIVSGQFEIIGGEVGEWNPFRWGLFQHPDIDELRDQYTPMALWGFEQYAGTDSAQFASPEGNAFGYLVVNQTGSEGPVGGNNGSGSLHAANGGSWISTFAGGTAVPLGSPFDHAPRRAVMPAGVYDFALSVQPQADGSVEVRWYIFHEDEQSYWHAGVHTDMTVQQTEFDGFLFSFRPEVEGITGINLYAVEVDRGAPIEIPAAPFSSFFVDQWGFLGNNFGAAPGDSSWALTPGAFVGDVTISGDAATGWATVAGSFGSSVTPTDEALLISGEITLEGGGFEDDNSFRFGLFNQDLGSQDSTETVGFVWSGDESASGYLIIPGNGTAADPAWTSGDAGTIGAINGGVWYDPAGEGAAGLGTTATATTGTPTAGTYEFEMSVQPTEFGNEIRVILSKEDDSYHYEASKFDASEAATSYNSIVFATNNSTTTELTIEALEIDMGDPIPISTDVDSDGSGLPMTFTLRQNYPNPFNPTTTIQFDLPETADVQLDVFNLLGQKVMTLVSGTMPAGVHQVNFNAQNLASGLYIYRIEAADFVSAKRMMLIK